jgi:predicted phage-related endonuclease
VITRESKRNIECHAIVDRAEWLELRKQDVTASVVGALLTEHDYATPMHLWAEHRGVEFEAKPENKRMRRGRKLEKLVGEEVEELHPDWKIEPVGAYYRDPELRLGATPDFWVLNDPRGRGVLQAKTAAPDIIAKKWDDGRVPPDWIVWQVRTEMLLTDAAFGAIAVLDPFNWDCYLIEVERNAEAELALVAAVKRFWELVHAGVEPEPDFTRDAAVVRALTRRETPGEVRDLSGNNALPDLLAARAMFKKSIAEYELRCEAIETELKFLMGEAEQAIGLNGWRVTYKTEHRTAYTVPAKDPRVLRIKDKRQEKN